MYRPTDTAGQQTWQSICDRQYRQSNQQGRQQVSTSTTTKFTDQQSQCGDPRYRSSHQVPTVTTSFAAQQSLQQSGDRQYQHKPGW